MSSADPGLHSEAAMWLWLESPSSRSTVHGFVQLPFTEHLLWDFPGWLDDRESACNAGDQIRSLGQEVTPREWNGDSLQYSCLENPMDRGAWLATVHGVTKSWTWLSDLSTHTDIFDCHLGACSWHGIIGDVTKQPAVHRTAPCSTELSSPKCQ